MSDTPTNTSGDLTAEQKAAFYSQLERENAELEATLRGIANAKPSEWGDMSDQFQEWAQSRARRALARHRANQTKEAGK